MNSLIQVDSNDFVLQSLSTIGTKIPKKSAYILLIKSYKCYHCIQYYPVYEQFAIKYPSVGFLVLEGPDNINMIHQWQELDSPVYGINGYPTVVAYTNDGNPSFVFTDRTDLTDINKLI